MLRCLDSIRLSKVIVLKDNYRVDSSTYLRKGKLEEVRREIELSEEDVNVLYVYDTLKPRQVVNLMRILRLEVKDKVGLILEIFAAHAGSKEAKLQIEMAEILHKLPLVKEWIRRSKMTEFPGFMGPGRYAVDAYYTHMRRRLSRIRRELNELRRRRCLARALRSSKGMPQIAIAGYANAGKTTLFNRLTRESKPTGPEMFTTLSPKSKAAYVNGVKVVFVDTVGFIRNVPHEVIEAFYATLEEIVESDLTVLVVDASESIDVVLSKLDSSVRTLRTIGFIGKPLIVALNKVDLIGDATLVLSSASSLLKRIYPWTCSTVAISALKGYGIDKLLTIISRLLKTKATLRLS